jgi:hypothetical protein
MDDYPAYREDDLAKREAGQIVKRYVRVLRQNLTPIPTDLPFKEYLRMVEGDTTVDPFDTLEMIGVPGADAAPTQAARPAAPRPATTEEPTKDAAAKKQTKDAAKKEPTKDAAAVSPSAAGRGPG